MNPPRIAVIILNWNGKDDTLACLASVTSIDYPDYQAVVVDNGSSDGSVSAFRQAYPQVSILETGANLGYAGGNNVGIRWALDRGFNYILLLNNDTIVSPDLLSAFMNAYNILSSNSVLGAKIYFYDTPDKLWFAGGKWNSALSSFEHIGYGQTDCSIFDNVNEVDYVTGCALFSSAATFREVGLLDERFFLTFEETDWCYRAKQFGHHCFYIPSARLWHKVSASFGGEESPLVVYFLQRNILLWAKKYLPTGAYSELRRKSHLILWNIFFPKFGAQIAGVMSPKVFYWLIRDWLNTIKHNLCDPINLATMLALRDYYLGRFGDCPSFIRKLARRSTKGHS